MCRCVCSSTLHDTVVLWCGLIGSKSARGTPHRQRELRFTFSPVQHEAYTCTLWPSGITCTSRHDMTEIEVASWAFHHSKKAWPCSDYVEQNASWMSQFQSAPTWRQRSARTDLEACVSENMSAHDHKVTDKCFGSLLMFQLFAYNKISRQPAFHGGDTTAPIFLRLIREEMLWELADGCDVPFGKNGA